MRGHAGPGYRRGRYRPAALVTSGDKGSDDPAATSAVVAARREREAEAAAAARCLGLADIAFPRAPDGEVEDTRALRAELVAWVRRWRPAVLFTHDPERPYPHYLSHRDHRTTGRATLDAVYPLARDRLSFPEHAAMGLLPHAVDEAWLFSSAAPTANVAIGAGFERKLQSRLAHARQTRDPEALATAWRERAGAIGAQAGVSMAQAFVVLRLG